MGREIEYLLTTGLFISTLCVLLFFPAYMAIVAKDLKNIKIEEKYTELERKKVLRDRESYSSKENSLECLERD